MDFAVLWPLLLSLFSRRGGWLGGVGTNEPCGLSVGPSSVDGEERGGGGPWHKERRGGSMNYAWKTRKRKTKPQERSARFAEGGKEGRDFKASLSSSFLARQNVLTAAWNVISMSGGSANGSRHISLVILVNMARRYSNAAGLLLRVLSSCTVVLFPDKCFLGIPKGAMFDRRKGV